jgi:YD repeat-containing protein
MKILAVSLGVIALATPAVSLAQVTQSYSYDANGRLTGVVTTNGSSTHTSAYAYDAANNRTSRSQSGSSTWAAISQLPVNQFLQPDEALVSPDGLYSYAMRPTGRMELWAGDALATSDNRALAAAFRLTDDGQAQFLPSLPDGLAPAGVSVSLKNNGQLALLDEAGKELWRSGDATVQGAGR